jgi:hypothetical protein
MVRHSNHVRWDDGCASEIYLSARERVKAIALILRAPQDDTLILMLDAINKTNRGNRRKVLRLLCLLSNIKVTNLQYLSEEEWELNRV